jgi:hypothetical protein
LYESPLDTDTGFGAKSFGFFWSVVSATQVTLHSKDIASCKIPQYHALLILKVSAKYNSQPNRKLEETWDKFIILIIIAQFSHVVTF